MKDVLVEIAKGKDTTDDFPKRVRPGPSSPEHNIVKCKITDFREYPESQSEGD